MEANGAFMKANRAVMKGNRALHTVNSPAEPGSDATNSRLGTTTAKNLVEPAHQGADKGRSGALRAHGGQPCGPRWCDRWQVAGLASRPSLRTIEDNRALNGGGARSQPSY
jgi:hypothetical protein